MRTLWFNCMLWFAGATRELGSGLTRFCLRHRNLEGKMCTLCRQDWRSDSDLFSICASVAYMLHRRHYVFVFLVHRGVCTMFCLSRLVSVHFSRPVPNISFAWQEDWTDFVKQGSRIREKMRIDVNRFCSDVKTGADGYHTFHPRTDDGRCVRVHNFMLIEQILLTNFIRRTTCIIHYTISFSCRHTHLRLSVRSLRFLPAMALPVGKRLRMSDKCSGGGIIWPPGL